MKISELIEELQSYKDDFGDLEVDIDTSNYMINGCNKALDSFRVVETPEATWLEVW